MQRSRSLYHAQCGHVTVEKEAYWSVIALLFSDNKIKSLLFSFPFNDDCHAAFRAYLWWVNIVLFGAVFSVVYTPLMGCWNGHKMEKCIVLRLTLSLYSPLVVGHKLPPQFDSSPQLFVYMPGTIPSLSSCESCEHQLQ